MAQSVVEPEAVSGVGERPGDARVGVVTPRVESGLRNGEKRTAVFGAGRAHRGAGHRKPVGQERGEIGAQAHLDGPEAALLEKG